MSFYDKALHSLLKEIKLINTNLINLKLMLEKHIKEEE